MTDSTKKPMSKFKIILAVIGGLIVLGFVFGGGTDKMAANQMQKIENQVAQDAIKQYEIALTGGDKVEIYVHAGMVTAAFLQAQDQENYTKWKAIERAAAKEAGMPTK